MIVDSIFICSKLQGFVLALHKERDHQHQQAVWMTKSLFFLFGTESGEKKKERQIGHLLCLMPYKAFRTIKAANGLFQAFNVLKLARAKNETSC